MTATHVRKINLIFPFDVPGVANKVALSVTTHVKGETVSFTFPFRLLFLTKPPNNSLPYSIKVKKNGDMFVYVLKFESIDLKRFLEKWELHVLKEVVEEYEEIMKEMDEKMEEYEQREKMGRKRKIVDDDGWVRYE